MESSEGELLDLSDISSDLDFFESIKRMSDRKLELEIESRPKLGTKYLPKHLSSITFLFAYCEMVYCREGKSVQI